MRIGLGLPLIVFFALFLVSRAHATTEVEEAERKASMKHFEKCYGGARQDIDKSLKELIEKRESLVTQGSLCQDAFEPRAHLDFGKNDSASKRRIRDADDALIEYTRTCYAGCAKRGGRYCEKVDQMIAAEKKTK